MFSTIIKVIRIAALLGVLGAVGFLGYEYVQTRDSSAVVETVKSTAETGAGEVRKGLQRLDLDRKVSDLQDKARPMGRKISATVGPKISPSFQAVQEGERRMSWPALILMFVFGSVFVLLGKYSDSGRY